MNGKRRLTAVASIKTYLLAAGLAGGIAAGGLAIASGRGATVSMPPLPMIVKTAIDVRENVLIITGRYFGATVPTVTLADRALNVKRFSEREVVASLPPGLASATYGITVITSGRNPASSNLFSATLP